VTIQVSRDIFSELPANEKALGPDGVKKRLLEASGGVCDLCGDPVNPDTQNLVGDHFDAKAGNGPTSLANLRLVHSQCNSVKRELPSVYIRPYLRLVRRIEHSDTELTYSEALPIFDIKPARIVITDDGKTLDFTFPGDHEPTSMPIFTEAVPEKKDPVRYCFVRVPRNAIGNDDACQPRSIKPRQVLAIFKDLLKNPLHEPPACRIEKSDGNLSKLLMFDGQHKSLATWSLGAQDITVKVYIDMTAGEAIQLVNSIQARIKKLPLSSLESVAKLDDEWKDKFNEYLTSVDFDKSSEAGFIDKLGPTEKANGRAALLAGRTASIVDKTSLSEYVLRGKKPPAGQPVITEKQFTDKAVKPLLETQPLKETGYDGLNLRKVEGQNAVFILDYLADEVFRPAAQEGSGPQEKTRAKRLSYQSSLKRAAEDLRKILANVCQQDAEQPMFFDVDDKQKQTFLKYAKNYFCHPIWTCPEDLGPRVVDFMTALSKNQSISEAANRISLGLGYALHPQLATNWSD
jgi:hypothetical protein